MNQFGVAAYPPVGVAIAPVPNLLQQPALHVAAASVDAVTAASSASSSSSPSDMPPLVARGPPFEVKAAERPFVDSVQAFLSEGFGVNEQDAVNGYSLLHYLAQYGAHHQLVRSLVTDQKANINARYDFLSPIF